MVTFTYTCTHTRTRITLANYFVCSLIPFVHRRFTLVYVHGHAPGVDRRNCDDINFGIDNSTDLRPAQHVSQTTDRHTSIATNSTSRKYKTLCCDLPNDHPKLAQIKLNHSHHLFESRVNFLFHCWVLVPAHDGCDARDHV